ncbi:MAG: hypothetical protein HYS65_09195, partial [Betaproteobacteria bacterium]|nr:hypothetical protein [Betaproteobacteria bacterium]
QHTSPRVEGEGARRDAERVGRFKSLQGNGPRYVTIYELEHPNVRESEEFARVKGWYQFTDFVIEPRISIYREFLAAEA